MKKIEVNEEMAYAIVEPGVTYFELHNYLRERKSRLWAAPPQPGWGSVIGNTLDRGLGYTAYADHSSTYCGLEVVLADGGLLRTGMGAMSESPTWALYRHGFGPGVDGLFQQSNLGVVTKMGVWLMPAPESFAVVQGWFPNEADVIPLIDTVRELRIADVMPPATITNFLRSATSMTTKAQWYKGEGAIPWPGLQADRGSRENMAPHQRCRAHRTALEGRTLQGRCPGARQSAGSAETRRLTTGHDQPSYTKFDNTSKKCCLEA